MRSRVACEIERPGTSLRTTETVAGCRPRCSASFFKLVVLVSARCFAVTMSLRPAGTQIYNNILFSCPSKIGFLPQTTKRFPSRRARKRERQGRASEGLSPDLDLCHEHVRANCPVEVPPFAVPISGSLVLAFLMPSSPPLSWQTLPAASSSTNCVGVVRCNPAAKFRSFAVHR
jgi:hypothetical protein